MCLFDIQKKKNIKYTDDTILLNIQDTSNNYINYIIMSGKRTFESKSAFLICHACLHCNFVHSKGQRVNITPVTSRSISFQFPFHLVCKVPRLYLRALCQVDSSILFLSVLLLLLYLRESEGVADVDKGKFD